MKFIHKFQQKIDILKTVEKLKIVRDNIVHYNVVHSLPSRIMNCVQ